MKIKNFAFLVLSLSAIALSFVIFRSTEWKSFVKSVAGIETASSDSKGLHSNKPSTNNSTTWDDESDDPDALYGNSELTNNKWEGKKSDSNNNTASKETRYTKENFPTNKVGSKNTKGAYGSDSEAIKTAKSILSKAKSAMAEPTAESASILTGLIGKLVDVANYDKNAFKAIALSFDNTTDPGMLNFLASAIGQTSRPEALEFAIDKVKNGEPNKARLIASFHILEFQNDRKSIPVVTGFLRANNDPDVQAAAVYALPVAQGVTKDEASNVAKVLESVLQSKNPEVRYKAALKYGHYAAGGDKEVLLKLSKDDPSAKVRAAAVFGFMYTTSDEVVLNNLINILSDESEVLQVRKNAIRVLRNQGPLDEEHVKVLEAYKHIMDR